MEILNIPIGKSEIVQGDTIPSILFEFDPTDNINLSLPNTKIRMNVMNNHIKIIDIFNGSGITILTPKSFRIDEVPKEQSELLPVGAFMGDLEITDSNGKKFTYFRVRYTIEKQYTK